MASNLEIIQLGVSFESSALARLEQIALYLDTKNIELFLVDEEHMLSFYHQAFGTHKVTDVLSFPALEMPMFLGSVVICTDVAQEMSANFGHDLESELCLLLIHGILHCQGFDHETDSGQHRSREEELIRYFGLPDSLITRAL